MALAEGSMLRTGLLLLLINFTSEPNVVEIIRIHWIWISVGSTLSIRVRSVGVKNKRMVFEMNSWSFTEFREPKGGVAVDMSSSISALLVGSQPTPEIGKDCVVIVSSFVVQSVPEIHVEF